MTFTRSLPLWRLAAWMSAVWMLAAAPACGATNAPLADAAERQDSATVSALLMQTVDLNASQADGMTALHWAAHYDDLPLARSLIQAGADARAENRYRVTPLALACMNGSGAMVELLLESKADANAALPGGETALMTAARTGRMDAVKSLIGRGADVNAREKKGQTALMWAAAEGHLDVVDALLTAGSDFRTATSAEYTPLFFAVREGRTAVALRLLQAGADVHEIMRPSNRDPKRTTNALNLAVENGHFELAASLLAHGANPNDQPAGYAALHAMSWVRKPIRGDGDPPPIGSGTVSSLDFVRRLVKAGADVNVRLEKGESGRGKFTMTGSTPFLLAARTADVPLMRLLLELGADPQLTNADASTPLMAAAGVGALGDGDEAAATEDETLSAVELLLDLGANINAVDNNGETAMHGAAYQDWSHLVTYLAKHGADIAIWNRENKWGWTPWLIAEGYRPGNFRPEPDTIAALDRVMRSQGVIPPPPRLRQPGRKGY